MSASLFPAEANEPNYPNKPNNQTFLNEVFRGLPEEVLPMVVGFPGDPSNVNKGVWSGRPWANEEFNTLHNNYFTISAFFKDKSGGYRRTKANFQGLYAIMLDDVGTKVPMEKITLNPSWMFETSVGNFQVGYILNKPITDASEADALSSAIIAAGLCDKGAGGPTARLARLPEGINGKRNPIFTTGVKTWAPERFSLSQLIEAYQLDLTAKPAAKKRATKVNERDEVFQPAPQDNPVLSALKSKDLYKKRLGEGRHDITCPWHQDHTGAVDDGAAYFEPSENFPVGGFKCQHSHGDNLSIADLLEFLGVPRSAAGMKPSIRVLAGQLHQSVYYAERVLADTGRYYHNGAGIVTLAQDPVAGSERLCAMGVHSLATALSASAVWERYSGSTKNYVTVDPPEKVIASLAAATEYHHLPHLIGLSHQPYLRTDGELVTTPGYNQTSFLYGAFDPAKYTIPDNPTKEEATEALGRLSGLLEEFPFATEYDKGAALSVLLTAVLRPALPLSPMYHVHAPLSGSGKSFLCELVGVMASSKKTNPTSFPQNDEECQKVLLAELLRAPAVIEFDNLTSDLLPHKSLCTVLTSETYSSRILGVSKTAEVSTRALFLSSGNNVMPVRDMARRCVTISLNPQCESPSSREFKRPNLINEVIENRAKYVSDVLTVVRAWVCAGKPQTACKVVGSYNVWTDLCRQPLLWLGVADPAQPLFDAIERDPDKELLGRLLVHWYKSFDSKPTMIRKVIQTANAGELAADGEESDLQALLLEIAGDGREVVNPQRLAIWVRRRTNRIVGNMRLVKSEGVRAAQAWHIELIK